jgi:hypothetical protein
MRDDPPSPAEVTRLTRDIYVPATDIGFWQGTFRDPQSDGYLKARARSRNGLDLFVDVRYGDVEGGQRTVTRFAMRPVAEDGWLVSAGRVWNLDRADPR